MTTPALKETALYPPIKLMLEGQGYVVKGEVGDADIVARRGDEEPVIVELKTGFSLALIHQAIERQAISDAVYVAVPRGAGRGFQKSLNSNKKLCRRLGLGLITVRAADGFTEIHLDPAPYRPHRVKAKRARLLREFDRLVGDPNTGGQMRRGLMTAYRQDALRCLAVLASEGPSRGAEVARLSGVAAACRLIAHNHYGWFERVSRGIYAPSPKGDAARGEYGAEIGRIVQTTNNPPASPS